MPEGTEGVDHAAPQLARLVVRQEEVGDLGSQAKGNQLRNMKELHGQARPV